MSSGASPAVWIARSAATAAMDAVVSFAAATRRSRMPVRVTIHSSEVSTIRSRSALVSTWAGAYRPQPVSLTERCRRGRHAGSTSMSGCLALTSAPLSAQTRTTRPARSLLISLNSFMASMRPMIWPTATWSPTAT